MSETNFKAIEKELDNLILKAEIREALLQAFFRGMDHQQFKAEENGTWISNKATSVTNKLLKNKEMTIIT